MTDEIVIDLYLNDGIVIDLVFINDSGGGKMMAVTNQYWCTEMVPSKGAFGVLAPAIVAQFPDLFADVRECEMQLVAIHFRNMTKGENLACQSYPTVIQPHHQG